MTVFASTDIPSSVNTLEKVVLWSAMALQTILGNRMIRVRSGAELVPQCSVTVGELAGGEMAFGIVVYIPTTRELINTTAAKRFTLAEEIANTLIPAGFKTN